MSPKVSIRVVAVILVLATPAVFAGNVTVQWDPSDSATSYTLYYGTSPGEYSASMNVGATTATVDGLTDCTVWYFAATASNAAGESGYSNEDFSMPRPILNAAAPSSVEQGRQLDLTLTGFNYEAGTVVEFSDAAVVVNSVTVNSCTEIRVNVTVGLGAIPGPVDVEVIRADGLRGTGSGVFVVEERVQPTVASTWPADGANNVSPAVEPTVQFSEPMSASSISSATVRLLDDGNNPVAQASGSPSLSGNATTAAIRPAGDLDQGGLYRIEVIGGGSGVLDLAGHSMVATYVQGTGFATTGDAVAPVISETSAESITATSAAITWTTDEPADSQVFFRVAGESIYQQTERDNTLVTNHAVTLEGLTPDTLYDFHVRSADVSGNPSTSSPDDSFTTSASPYDYMEFEAEAGVLTDPMRVTSGAGAFATAWIDTPSGSGSGGQNTPLGTATFGVHVPAPGTWYLWVRIHGENAQSNSLFESIDGANRSTIGTQNFGDWTWVEGRAYSLDAGLHTVEISGREAGARADRILLTNDPDFVAAAQPGSDVTPPSAVAGFAATAGDGSIELAWTNPSNDYARTVVRYRTDGQFPVSPVDGLPLVDAAGAPGGSGDHAHEGLENGVTYYYSAFAVDGAGNASQPAHAEATPETVPLAPTPPTNLRVIVDN